jgi:cyanate lyase
MTMNNLDTDTRDYRRHITRAAFQSLFWNVLLKRKKDSGLTLKGLADKLGVHKSYMTRSFSSPPNWQIDKLSDLADALGVDLVIEARDQQTGCTFTAFGVQNNPVTMTAHDLMTVYPTVEGPTSGKETVTRVTA